MTSLARLRRLSVFDPSPVRADLPRVHVPFETLVPGQSVESRAVEALRSADRVAIIGPAGSGKSSAIGHILSTASDVAGIRISVEAQTPEVVSEPAAFAGHVIRELQRLVANSQRPRRRGRPSPSSATRATVEGHRKLGGRLGLPSWLADASLAGDLESVLSATVETPASELFQTAEEAIATVAARDLNPILVIDDSDAWLRTELGDRSHLVGSFFGRVLPTVVKELSVGLLVAVHDDYLSMSSYPRSQGWLNTEINLPRLPEASAIRQIVDARVAAVGAGESSTSLLTDPGLGEMYRYYHQRHGNLRQTMYLLHTALSAAVDDGADRIEQPHFAVAISRIGQ